LAEYASEAGELVDSREAPPSVFTSALVQELAPRGRPCHINGTY